MYIKVEKLAIYELWRYEIYAANHRTILKTYRRWVTESACIRAAKKMAKKLNIEYREN